MIYRQIVQHIAIYSAYPVCIPFAEELFPTVIKITSYKNVYSYFSSWFFFFFFFFFLDAEKIWRNSSDWMGQIPFKRKSRALYLYSAHTCPVHWVLIITFLSLLYLIYQKWIFFFFSKRHQNPHRWTISRPSLNEYLLHSHVHRWAQTESCPRIRRDARAQYNNRKKEM